MDSEKLDRLLDQIEEFDVDSYIDAQLRAGPQNQDSFRGQYQRKCRWCPEPWHGLPITKRMREMRQNPYGHDEFGQPIMDPNYRYDEDQSDWVCPGSDYHGPETANRSWRTPRGAAPFQFRSEERNPPRVWRFKPPYDNWDVDLEQIWLYSSDPGVEPRSICRATFKVRDPIRMPPEMMGSMSHPWWRDVVLFAHNHQAGAIAEMRPIVFEYEDVRLRFESPRSMQRGDNPSWVEFITAYDFTRHPWCVEQFQSRELTEEERDYGFPASAIAEVRDERISFDLEGFNHDLERIRGSGPQTQASPVTQRGPEVSQGRGEVPASEEDGVEEGSCG